MNVVVEGPDKCGKTTMAKAMASVEQCDYKRLPESPIRDLVFSGEFKDAANSFLFFADATKLWNNADNTSFILDRDILSMIAYQGYLLNAVNPIILLNLYKSIVYAKNKPDKIYYIVSEPFEPYDEEDPFESHGYEAIRASYEKAVNLVRLNFPELPILFIDATNLTKLEAPDVDTSNTN